MATPAGIEPATSCLEGTCSIQLSYGVTDFGINTQKRPHARLEVDWREDASSL